MKINAVAWLKKKIRDTFGFSERETNGTIFLWFLMLLCWVMPNIYTQITTSKSPNDGSKSEQMDAFIAQLKEVQATERPDFDEVLADNIADSLFFFNPNEISVTEWQKLGVNEKFAKSIRNYVEKGGKFRKKTDLQKIYGFPSELYQKLEQYIQLDESQTYAKRYSKYPKYNKERDTSAYKKFKKEYPKKEYARKQVQPLDINTADTTQFKQIKGIGSKISARIIAYRERLGGFHSVRQIREVYGLDTSQVVDVIEQYAQFQTPVKTLKINEVTAEELQKHPYVRKGLAKVIVNYRVQHGRFESIEDVAKIKILKIEDLEKLKPYFSYQ